MKTPFLSRFLCAFLLLAAGAAAWAEEAQPKSYELTVGNGTDNDRPKGSGRAKYVPGTKVAVKAHPAPKDMAFDQWVGNVEALADPMAPETAVTMPAAATQVSACYKTAAPKPLVHSLFQDHMVLQRDVKVPIWGWTEPGRKVAVEVAGETAEAAAGQDGRWLVTMGPFKAGGPHTIKVAGPTSVTLNDVMIGDVWVGSGQSNMHLTGPDKEDAATADDPAFRFLMACPGNEDFGSPRPLEYFAVTKGQWRVCRPDGAGHCSKTAFYFGRALRQQLKVPVGLIVVALNGSPIEAWIPRESLMTLPEHVENGKFKYPWSLSWGNGQFPYCRYNAQIHPLAPFAIKGFLWYQGETNAGRDPIRYRDLLPMLIKDWRALWGGEPIPFITVQLHLAGQFDPKRPPSSRREKWVELEEAQRMSLKVPQTGLVVTVDLADRDSLHPPNKKGISERAVLVARKVAYGEDVVALGPIYKGMKVEGEAVRLSFDSVGGGLASKDGQPLRYFAIAGEDRKFVWAEARIDKDTVLVSSPQVKSPVAVRYAWGSGQKEANLGNREGLPASPFRTDDWSDKE